MSVEWPTLKKYETNKQTNIGSRLAKEWHDETASPREAHRVTSKDVRATAWNYSATYSMTGGKCRTTSVCVPCACGQSGPEAGRKQVFSGKLRWLGQRRMDRGPGFYVSDAIHTVTGVSTSSTLTLWILCEHSKPQPAWFALPRLLLYSTQHLHSFTGRNSCGHSPFLYENIIMDHGWPVPGATSLLWSCSLRDGVSVKTDSMAWLRKSGGDRMMIIRHIGQVLWRWFFSSSLHLRLLSGLSPYSEPPFQVSSRLHWRLCGELRDDSLLSSPRQ